MVRQIAFRAILNVALSIVVASPGVAARAQDGGQDKNLDIRSSAGDLHMGTDADARKTGLQLYPGARLRHDKDDSNAVNLGLFTEAFGMKLVVAKYESDDAPSKVVDYYRERLKKYGKVVECHTHEHDGDVHTDINDDKNFNSKELKCEGDNTGPVTELKVGTEDNQHIVAIGPNEARSGSTFALVYMHMRGKQGDL
jgi:hypothetical protein